MRLSDVYPWGHNLAAYRAIFNLNDQALTRPIVSFADGTSSANSELTGLGCAMVSVDPVYQFSAHDIHRRLVEMMEQAEAYHQQLAPDDQQEAKDIADLRVNATLDFLEDFELGKERHRYLVGALPGPLSLADNTFDIGLCAHFLLLYDNYGLRFHIEAITEMLRICREIRIYPTINLQGQQSQVLDGVIKYFASAYTTRLEPVDYGYQGMGNQLLRIGRCSPNGCTVYKYDG